MLIEVRNKVTLAGFGGAAVGPGNLIAPAGWHSRFSKRDNA